MPSGIDLLDNKRREQRMTGNVIIPDNMNIRKERKIYSDEELNEMSNRPSQSSARTIEQSASTLPGLEDLDKIPQARSVEQPASTLPGLEDLDNIPQTRLVQHPENLIPDVNSDSQMQMEAVASQPEIPQEQKRGRGRPRKNPVEPPKPKGKRGRPRKNPLPEENIEKEKIIPGVNDFENIPKVDKIQQTESTTQPKNIRQTDEWNNIENIPEQTNNISKNVDWNNDPFEGKTNQQIANSLPGLDDLAENTQPSTLPGMNDWDNDTFEQSNNVQQQDRPSTLPGMNDWNNNLFETNQTNNSNESITLSSSVVQPNMNQNNEMDYNKQEPKIE